MACRRLLAKKGLFQMVYKWRNDSNFLNCLEAERRRLSVILPTEPLRQLLAARQHLTSR